VAGKPAARTRGGTRLFRGLSFWLPMLPGWWITHRETKQVVRKDR
jgi:hypothetical protein